MICSACGCGQFAGAQFCRQCGAQLAAANPNQQIPPQYHDPMAIEQRMRVRQNLQPLGIIWIMFGVYRIATGLIGAFVLHHMVRHGAFSDGPAFLPGLLGSVVPAIATLSAVMGLASIAAGCGLISRQPWARVVALVLGVLTLIKIPFGTALGIYTLWVLAPQASGDEWQALSSQP